MDNKEKLIVDPIDTGVTAEKTGDAVNSGHEFVEEPTVIHLGENDSDRVYDSSDDEDASYEKSALRKRPKDSTLLKISAISCILGVLSCTIFLGNVPLAVIGILFGLTAEANKYKNAYTKIGLICCTIGCIIGFALVTLFVALVIAFIVALFLVALLALLALLVWVVALALLLPL